MVKTNLDYIKSSINNDITQMSVEDLTTDYQMGFRFSMIFNQFEQQFEFQLRKVERDELIEYYNHLLLSKLSNHILEGINQ